jgi:hypothetical protein
MSYTNRFTEAVAVLGGISPASYTADQETAWLDIGLYHRALVVVHCGVLGTGLYVDVHEATDTAGGGEDDYADSEKDLTIGAADDNGLSFIEIRPGELTPNHHHCIKVLVSGDSQTACVYGVAVLGLEPRFAAVSTAGVDHISD